MLILACQITIYEVDKKGNLTGEVFLIDTVNELEIESTWREFTDTATITLPRFIDTEIGGVKNRRTDFRQQLLRWAAHHPPIEIRLGYGKATHLAFNGVIRDVKGRVPVTLVCEDAMYHFKTGPVTFSSENATLKDITNTWSSVKDAHGSTIPVVPQDLIIGTFRVTQPMTPAKVMEKLKDDFGIYSFIRLDQQGKPRLVLGINDQVQEDFVLNETTDTRVLIGSGREEALFVPDEQLGRSFNGNFVFYQNIIEDELEYKLAEDVRVRVVYIARGKDEKDELKVVLPSPDLNKPDTTDDLEERTFHHYDPDLKLKGDPAKLKAIREELKAKAKQNLDLIKYDGFRGSFTTFGDTLFEDPNLKSNLGGFVKHGNYVQLKEQDKIFGVPDEKRNQMYFVDGVTYSYGESGFRQRILLGREKRNEELI